MDSSTFNAKALMFENQSISKESLDILKDRKLCIVTEESATQTVLFLNSPMSISDVDNIESTLDISIEDDGSGHDYSSDFIIEINQFLKDSGEFYLLLEEVSGKECCAKKVFMKRRTKKE